MNEKLRYEKIGPEKAKEYLAQMPPSSRRSRDKNFVTALAERMRTGKWLRDGEPLHFMKGRMFGRARLMAVIEAGVEIEFSIYEIDEDFPYILP